MGRLGASGGSASDLQHRSTAAGRPARTPHSAPAHRPAVTHKERLDTEQVTAIS